MGKLIAERLREVLRYDPCSGVFIWKVGHGPVKAGDVAGYLRTDGYISISVDGKNYLAHRLAFLYCHGKFPNQEVDHILGDRSFNRFFNLRLASRTDNMQNRKRFKNNTSGAVGVYWFKPGGKWVAQITVDRIPRHLGCFYNFLEAVKARKEAEVLYGFHKNHGNS